MYLQASANAEYGKLLFSGRRKYMDVERIQQTLEDFKFYSTPSNGDSSAPATVGDIRNLINQIEKLVNEIIES